MVCSWWMLNHDRQCDACFSGSSLERDSRAAGVALFSLRIDQGNKGREIIARILTALVKMQALTILLDP
ncbi:hypothetical protein Bca4012_025836 [Brassica carinata]